MRSLRTIAPHVRQSRSYAAGLEARSRGNFSFSSGAAHGKVHQLMQIEYKVKLEVFEGPLDLLLYLIKKDEVDIYGVSIERITSQYLEYLETFRMLDLEIAGEFVVMAANLIYMKSRSLLPVHQQPPDEEAEEEDPRWDFIRQLVEYKKFKD